MKLFAAVLLLYSCELRVAPERKLCARAPILRIRARETHLVAVLAWGFWGCHHGVDLPIRGVLRAPLNAAPNKLVVRFCDCHFPDHALINRSNNPRFSQYHTCFPRLVPSSHRLCRRLPHPHLHQSRIARAFHILLCMYFTTRTGVSAVSTMPRNAPPFPQR